MRSRVFIIEVPLAAYVRSVVVKSAGPRHAIRSIRI
jgi:hypothetical protein